MFKPWNGLATKDTEATAVSEPKDVKCLSRDSHERGDSLSLVLQSDQAQRTHLKRSTDLTKFLKHK